MAARYWRITGIETYGGGDLELSELQLFALDANNNPVRVDQTATLTSSVPPISGTLSALNDGDTSTTAQFPTGPGLSFVWDFGVGVGYDMIYVGIGAGQSADRFLTSFVLQSSADGTAWTTAYHTGTLKFPGANVFIQHDVSVDPYYHTNVTLLAPLDTRFSITDASPYKKPITPYGGITVSTANGKFGYGSVFFDGVDDYLTVPASQDFAFGTGDFTVEVWVYVISYSDSYITTRKDGISYGCWGMSIQKNFIFCEVTDRLSDRLTSSKDVKIGSWSHLAASRSNGVLKLFLNGEVVAEKKFTNNLNNYSYNLIVGRLAPNESRHFNGYMNDLRITKGVGRYTANFIPPLPAGNPVSVNNQWIVADTITTRMAESYQILGADVPPFTTATASPPIAIDIIDGGTGRLTGTVREKTGISTRPLKRRVVLLDYRSNRKLRETVSDEQTGIYSFDEIDLAREYTVIALDHTGQYRAVIADKLVPEKML